MDINKDQYFLHDEEILSFEADIARLKKGDVVLEIGAGSGNLTKHLARKTLVLAIETDQRFFPTLEKIENCKLIHGNALEALELKRKNETDLEFNKVVSNIPYSISQEIIVELLQHRWEITVLCVQKEFAQKLQQNTKLGFVVRDCCELRYMSDVPPSAFSPKAVDSSIILLKQQKLLDMKFWRFLDVVFRKKNKDVKNVVSNAPEKLAKKKVHQLTVDELKQLYASRPSVPSS